MYPVIRRLLAAGTLAVLGACSSAYYETMETFGFEKATHSVAYNATVI